MVSEEWINQWWTEKKDSALVQIESLTADELREAIRRSLEATSMREVAPTLTGAISGLFYRKQVSNDKR